MGGGGSRARSDGANEPIGAAVSSSAEAGADLAGSEQIQAPQLAETLQYRPKVMG